MATQAGHETRDPAPVESWKAEYVQAEYFVWSPAPNHGDLPVSIQVHPDVMDGIARDVSESPGIEVGGLLLGSVSPQPDDTALIRIDRYHRILCNHLTGP